APTASPFDQSDLDSFLDSWSDLDDAEEGFVVSLGAVPTDLLLEAKAHIDNLVREFTLAGSAADRGSEDDRLSAELAELVRTVVHDFADARLQIKQQALASAARDEPSTELRLTLPASAADAGERYLAALDEADRYARGARLLTLETPPVHRVFREWYVGALVQQLRAIAADEPPPAMSSFSQRLAVEVANLAPLREVSRRLQLLQRVTAELTGAQTTDDVVSTVCTRAYDVLGALSARVYLLEDGMLRSAATSGRDPSLANQYEEFPADADLPGGIALRT